MYAFHMKKISDASCDKYSDLYIVREIENKIHKAAKLGLYKIETMVMDIETTKTINLHFHMKYFNIHENEISRDERTLTISWK